MPVYGEYHPNALGPAYTQLAQSTNAPPFSIAPSHGFSLGNPATSVDASQLSNTPYVTVRSTLPSQPGTSASQGESPIEQFFSNFPHLRGNMRPMPGINDTVIGVSGWPSANTTVSAPGMNQFPGLSIQSTTQFSGLAGDSQVEDKFPGLFQSIANFQTPGLSVSSQSTTQSQFPGLSVPSQSTTQSQFPGLSIPSQSTTQSQFPGLSVPSQSTAPSNTKPATRTLFHWDPNTNKFHPVEITEPPTQSGFSKAASGVGSALYSLGTGLGSIGVQCLGEICGVAGEGAKSTAPLLSTAANLAMLYGVGSSYMYHGAWPAASTLLPPLAAAWAVRSGVQKLVQ